MTYGTKSTGNRRKKHIRPGNDLRIGKLGLGLGDLRKIPIEPPRHMRTVGYVANYAHTVRHPWEKGGSLSSLPSSGNQGHAIRTNSICCDEYAAAELMWTGQLRLRSSVIVLRRALPQMVALVYY